MKRTPLSRKTPMRRGDSQLKRSRVKPKRATPRRRPAPRWSFDDWLDAGPFLEARSGGVCEWCGKPGQLERHHRMRRRDGGETFPNLLVLCSEDHAWAHAHPVKAREFGLIVATYNDPAETPFLARKREWVLFTEDGGSRPAFDVPA